MKKTGAILAVLILFFASPAFTETSIKAEIDKQSISADETLTYKLNITASVKNIPAPDLPAFEGFVVLSRVQNSRISISAGAQTGSTTYVFVLSPVKAGKFEIGPSRVKIEGKDYASETFEVEVTQVKTGPGAGPQEKPSVPQEAPSGASEPSRITL